MYLHVQVTSMWLYDAGAPIDLQHEVASLARRVAQEHGEPITLAMAALTTINRPMANGQFDLAEAELNALTLPATTSDTASVVDWLYRGVARFFPEEWERFRAAVPEPERDGDADSSPSTTPGTRAATRCATGCSVRSTGSPRTETACRVEACH